MIDFTEVHDISLLMGVENTTWPGDPPYSRRLISSIRSGGISDVSQIAMTVHTGTHLDCPAHFLAGARKLDDYRPEEFILPACVIECDQQPAVGPEAVRAADVQPGEAVLFKTLNSKAGRAADGQFHADGVYLSPAAAELCIARKAALVGIDYPTVDRYGEAGFPVHRSLLSAGVLILENVNLRSVPAGRYTLLCPPLRLADCEGAPVRALLLR